MERGSGILLHISSLYSDYGIGSLGKSAYNFVDFLVNSGQKYWQVLPLCPTGYGDSPYQSCSSSALNQYFIDLDELIDMGLLKNEDCEKQEKIDYAYLFNTRIKLLKKAFGNFNKKDKEFLDFLYRGEYDNYALYMSLKLQFDYKPWYEWSEKYKLRDSEELKNFKDNNIEEWNFWQWTQFIFIQQWTKVKKYANDRDIKIIGDMPIYISYDSVDVWQNPKIVLIDDKYYPTLVAGVPPDNFAKTGQLWGNPIYDWKAMEKDGYGWWIERVKKAMKQFDLIRIDHFRGFDKFYSVPFGSVNAADGKWHKGCGIKLFSKINTEIPNVKIIAEDLGFIDFSARKMQIDSGYPGMKIFQFAIKKSIKNQHNPINYKPNCVAYTGTHDNETLRECIENLKNRKKFEKLIYKSLKKMNIDCKPEDDKSFGLAIIELLYASRANLCIIPMQDILWKGAEARMNFPSKLSCSNWSYKLNKDECKSEIEKYLKKLTIKYKR